MSHLRFVALTHRMPTHRMPAAWPHRPSDPQHANQILASVFLHLLFSSSQNSSVWHCGSEASHLSRVCYAAAAAIIAIFSLVFTITV